MKAVLDLLLRDSKNVALTWLSVVTRGHAALAATKFTERAVQLYALRFALYMALVAFLLNVPLVSALRENFLGSLSLAYTIGTFAEYVSGGVILHVAMRALGGAGTLQISLTIFALLTAYLPLVTIAFWPIQETLLGPSLGGGGDFPTTLDQMVARYATVSGWGFFVMLLSFVSATGIFIYMYVQVFFAFRAIHALSARRAAAAFVLGVVGHFLFVAVFITPLVTNLYRAVGKPTGSG